MAKSTTYCVAEYILCECPLRDECAFGPFLSCYGHYLIHFWRPTAPKAKCLDFKPFLQVYPKIHSLSLYLVRLFTKMGSGSGSVGRAVASNTRSPWFEASHRQKIDWTFVYLFTINCIEKMKINKKRPGRAYFKKDFLLRLSISKIAKST